MDELEIDGKKYLSSRRAAKEHKYHIDYIGQLIRAGKVSGKKVGRSWYVEAASLASYLSQEAGNPPVAQPAAPEIVQPAPAPEPGMAPVAYEMPVAQPTAPAPIFLEPQIIEAMPQHVEIKIAAPMPVPHVSAMTYEEEERHVPISTPAPVAERKQSTVRYIEEDAEPMLPVLKMRSNADFVAVPMRKIAEPMAQEEVQEEEQNSFVPPVQQKIKRNARGFSFPRMQVIAVVALAVLALTAAGSVMLATSIKVADGQAASVGVTFK